MVRTRPRIALLFTMLLSCLAAPLTTFAQDEDFAVFVTVTLPDQSVESVTAFHAGRVYDFLLEPAETTIFDPSRNRFIVLSPALRLKAEVTTAEIDAHASRLRSEVLAGKVPLLQFLADPQFEETYDPVSGQLDLESSWMSY